MLDIRHYKRTYSVFVYRVSSKYYITKIVYEISLYIFIITNNMIMYT